MEFSKLIVTQKGKELIAAALEKQFKINFTKVATTSATYDFNKLEELTSITDVKQVLLISKKEVLGSSVKIETVLTNEELLNGYYLHTVGLYAIDTLGNEILYAVAVETSGNCYIPSYNGNTVTGLYINLITKVENTTIISLEINPAAVATVEDVYAIHMEVIEINENVSIHIGNKSNPHDVTKSQIGLNNVDNTADKDKPVSNLVQRALDLLYAQANGYTDLQIASLIDGAPETMNTLRELADAISSNSSIMDTLNEAIGKKAAQAELDGHIGNTTIHVTATERTTWNAKQDAITVDSVMSSTSTNPVQNKVITAELNNKLATTGNASNTTNTFTQASTLATLTTGEKLSVSLGKVMKAITDFITHKTDNTIHVTATERTTWNAKQDAITVDSVMSSTSTNPVQNKVINTALETMNTNFQAGCDIISAAVTAKGVSMPSNSSPEIIAAKVAELMRGNVSALMATNNMNGDSGTTATALVSTATATATESGKMLVVAIYDRFQYANGTSDYSPTIATTFTRNGNALTTFLSKTSTTYASSAVKGSVRYIKAAIVDADMNDVFSATVTVTGYYQTRGVQLLLFKIS